MKVNRPVVAPHPQTPTDKSKDKGDASAQPHPSHVTARDFASVFEEVVRPRPTNDHDANEHEIDERHEDENRASARAEREREARRREDHRDDAGAGSGFDQRGGVRQSAPPPEAANARAILHIADLERIIAAIRIQLTAQGRRQVMLELKNSVLEGLRVKLSTDEAGRVTAEFIAASERVRAQIDARSAELADLLRSRGLSLAALKTTVGTESSGQDGAESQQHITPESVERAAVTAAAKEEPARLNDLVEDDSGADASARTYRA
jgi:hypothetical protein